MGAPGLNSLHVLYSPTIHLTRHCNKPLVVFLSLQVPKERLDRVVAASIRALLSNPSAVVVPGETLGVGSYVALAYEMEDNKFQVWYGRVVVMSSPVKSKMRILDYPVNLEKVNPETLLVCDYFYETELGSGKYRFGMKPGSTEYAPDLKR